MIYTVESEIKVSTERMRAQKTATIMMIKSKGDEKRINIWTNESNKSESQSANYFNLPYLY